MDRNTSGGVNPLPPPPSVDVVMNATDMATWYNNAYCGEHFCLPDPGAAKFPQVYQIESASGRWCDSITTLGRRLTALVKAHIPELIQKEDGAKRKDTLTRAMAKWLGPGGFRELYQTLSTTSGMLVMDGAFLNRDCSVICCPNGMVDLASSTLIDPKSATRRFHTLQTTTRFVPEAKHPMVPEWDAEKGYATGGLFKHLDADNCRQLCRELGYSMWGEPNRRVILVTGPTEGGKSKFALAIKVALGNAYKGTLTSSILAGKEDRSDVRSMEQMGRLTGGVRLAILEEPKMQAFDRATLKRISGDGDDLNVGGLYQSARQEPPTATVFIFSNEREDYSLPRIGLDDEAVAKRVRLIEVPSIPEDEQDETLGRVIRTKRFAEAMLALLVRLASAFRDKPPESDSSLLRKQELIEQEGGLLREFVHMLIADPNVKTPMRELWHLWAKLNDEDDRSVKIGGTHRNYLLRDAAKWRADFTNPKTIQSGADRYLPGWRIKTDEEMHAEPPF